MRQGQLLVRPLDDLQDGEQVRVLAARDSFLKDAVEALALRRLGHRGPLMALSRRGQFDAKQLAQAVKEFMGGSQHPGKDRTEGGFGFAGHNDPVAFRQ